MEEVGLEGAAGDTKKTLLGRVVVTNLCLWKGILFLIETHNLTQFRMQDIVVFKKRTLQTGTIKTKNIFKQWVNHQCKCNSSLTIFLTELSLNIHSQV